MPDRAFEMPLIFALRDMAQSASNPWDTPVSNIITINAPQNGVAVSLTGANALTFVVTDTTSNNVTATGGDNAGHNSNVLSFFTYPPGLLPIQTSTYPEHVLTVTTFRVHKWNPGP